MEPCLLATIDTRPISLCAQAILPLRKKMASPAKMAKATTAQTAMIHSVHCLVQGVRLVGLIVRFNEAATSTSQPCGS